MKMGRFRPIFFNPSKNKLVLLRHKSLNYPDFIIALRPNRGRVKNSWYLLNFIFYYPPFGDLGYSLSVITLAATVLPCNEG